jgi:hypothetical protein
MLLDSHIAASLSLCFSLCVVSLVQNSTGPAMMLDFEYRRSAAADHRIYQHYHSKHIEQAAVVHIYHIAHYRSSHISKPFGSPRRS